MEHRAAQEVSLIAISDIEATDTGEKIAGRGLIQLYSKSLPTLEVADHVILKKMYFRSPQSLSYNKYLIKEGIVGSFFIWSPTFEIIYKPTLSWTRFVQKQKIQLLNRLQEKLDSITFSLFSSIFLGNSTFYKKDRALIKERFTLWGIAHHLARSGLHLAIFIIVSQFFYRFIPLNFFYKELFLLMITLFYFIFSWSSISFIRAISTFCLSRLCVLYKKQVHLLHLLSLVCFLTLCYNPFQLFFLDFQLSFFLTASLLIFNQAGRREEVATY